MKLKRIYLIGTITFAVMICAVFMFKVNFAQAKKTYTLRMAYPSADRGFAPEMIKWWGENLESRTGGKVKIQYYWGGILGTSKEMLYSIEKGTCDIGVIFPMYFSAELPLATANTCIISTFENDPAATSRAWAQLATEFPEIPAEWEAHNQKLLMGWEVGSYLWVSKKPIRAFGDLKRLKTGVWGGKGPRQLAVELGSIPRSIPSVEVYDALDKSTIGARAESTPMVKTYKHYEICKYITDIGVGTIGAPVYAMSINLKTWNSLPNDIKGEILQVTKDWWAFFEKRVTETQENDRKFLQKNGMEFIKFSDADKAKVQALPVYKNFRSNYINRVKDQDLATKIFDRYRQLLKKK